MKKLSDTEFKSRIRNFGWHYVSGSYQNRRSVLLLKCKYGHILKRSLAKLSIDNGYCYKCKKDKNNKSKLELANKVAKSNKGKCLSKKYFGYKEKHRWRCSSGHIWEASFYSVAGTPKSWCPKCSTNNPNTIVDAHNIAKHNGGRCLSTYYKNANSHLKWECNCGYTWKASFDNVKNNNTWCPKCNSGNYIDIDFVKQYISNKRGVCLSQKYKNGKTKMTFMCENKHIWNTSFTSIYHNGSWCPMCSKTNNKSQTKLFNIIKDIYKNKDVIYNFTGFDWLRTSKYGKQEIDIWVPHIKLAIEYDGEQHFKPMRFGNKEKMLKKLKIIQKRDKVKNKKISDNKNDVKYFIRINYKEKLNKGNIIDVLKYHNVPITRKVLNNG